MEPVITVALALAPTTSPAIRHLICSRIYDTLTIARVAAALVRTTALLLAVCFVVPALFGCSGSPVPSTAPQEELWHGTYIWQRRHTPELGKAIADARLDVDRFFVFAGELTLDHGRVAETLFPQEWSAFAPVDRPVILVFRIAASLESTIRTSGPNVVESLVRMTEEVLKSAKRAGLSVSGIQLDYDSPTSKLAGYTALLRLLGTSVPDVEISITALPSWLGSPEFSRLARSCSWFTLQVHGVERPAGLDAPLVLCDYDRVPEWVEQAAAVGRPFCLALPTYTWRCLFNDDGRFVGFAGEQQIQTGSDVTVRLAASDPVRLASIVHGLNTTRPPNLLGILWFRQPVFSDRWNWSWPVLQKVMKGLPPDIGFIARVDRPQPSLYEIHVSSLASEQTPTDLHISVRTTGRVAARDVTAGYQFAGDGLRGPALPPGTSLRIAWFRVNDTVLGNGHDHATSFPISCGEV